MNERIKQLAEQAGIMVTPWYRDEPPHNVDLVHMDSSIQLEKFAMLVIQDYENDKRESCRDTMSELGYSRIGRGNV